MVKIAIFYIYEQKVFNRIIQCILHIYYFKIWHGLSDIKPIAGGRAF